MGTVNQKHPKLLPALLIVIGGMLIVFAFLADLLGYGDTGSFGIGQLFLLIAGAIVFLFGALGRKFIQIYRDFAVLFLNTLALLELGAIIIGRPFSRVRQADIENLPYYANKTGREFPGMKPGLVLVFNINYISSGSILHFKMRQLTSTRMVLVVHPGQIANPILERYLLLGARP